MARRRRKPDRPSKAASAPTADDTLPVATAKRFDWNVIATWGGVVVALGIGVANYVQVERLQQRQQFPLVKVVGAGKQASLEQLEQQANPTGDFIVGHMSDLAMIRNLGNGPAFNVSGAWTDDKGEWIGDIDIEPAIHLPPLETASVVKLPWVFFEERTRPFTLNGHIELRYFDIDGSEYTLKQPFELENQPDNVVGSRTVLRLGTSGTLFLR